MHAREQLRTMCSPMHSIIEGKIKIQKSKFNLIFSCTQTFQISAPTNNITTYSIKTPYWYIEENIGSEEENLTIVLSYKDVTNIIENEKKNNLEEINLKFYVELQNNNHPEQTIVTNLQIPAEIIYLTPQHPREM